MSLKFKIFQDPPALRYGFSGKCDGSMDRFLEEDNRRKYFESRGIDFNRVVTADLAHKSKVAKVSDKEVGGMVTGSDGLVTDSKNLFLSATGADCFLLYFYDPIKGVVGVAHVGWRGLLAGIVENLVDNLAGSFGVNSRDLLVGIGPGIRRCHFEINSADCEKFREYSNFIIENEKETFVDLPGIIKNKLQSRGVPVERTEDSNKCTHCNDDEYFSYRRDKPENVQSQVGYIGLI